MALRRAQPPAEAPWRPSLNPQLCLEGPCAKPKPACEQSQLRGLSEVTPPAVPQAATLGWLPAGPGRPWRFLRLSHPSPQLPGCPAACSSTAHCSKPSAWLQGAPCPPYTPLPVPLPVHHHPAQRPPAHCLQAALPPGLPDPLPRLGGQQMAGIVGSSLEGSKNRSEACEIPHPQHLSLQPCLLSASRGGASISAKGPRPLALHADMETPAIWGPARAG